MWFSCRSLENNSMSIVLVLGGLVAFVAPILLHIFYFSGKQVLYEGAATCRSYTKTVFERERSYALVFVEVPGIGEILTEISHARAMTLSQMSDPVTVKVVKQAFKSAHIESIAFADEAPEPAAPSYDGLGLSLYYFFLAFAALLWLPGKTDGGALAQHVALYFSALSFAAAGFSINALSKDKDKIELRKAQARAAFHSSRFRVLRSLHDVGAGCGGDNRLLLAAQPPRLDWAEHRICRRFYPRCAVA